MYLKMCKCKSLKVTSGYSVSVRDVWIEAREGEEWTREIKKEPGR